jgi:thiol-disulfide isomerase/thioredoxin
LLSRRGPNDLQRQSQEKRDIHIARNLTRCSAVSKTIATLSLLLAGACEPDARSTPEYREPVVLSSAGVRIVHNFSAPESQVPRTGIPRNARLLFAGVVAAAQRGDGTQAVIAPDGARVLEFDESGRFARSVGDMVLKHVVGVIAHGDDWVVTEREGSHLRIGSNGVPRATFSSAFGTAVVAAIPDGYVAARSPFAIATSPLPPRSPLLVELAPGGQIRAMIDTIVSTVTPEAGFLANAGILATRDSVVFFAFLSRDEIRAYDLKGRLRWVSDRGIGWATAPGITQTPSGSELRFRAVNLGMAATERGLFVLSYADTSERAMRLDLLDPETGVLTRSTSIPSGPWLISLDQRGAIWIAHADTVTRIATPAQRPQFANIRLPTITGDTFDLASLRGKVTLVNFWASWCPPCRQEFPLMNQLARDYPAEEFAIVAVNEDIDESAARAFLAELPASFVVPLGRGRMQEVVAYRGLPFTVLLDRKGAVIERFFGFGGPAQFRILRARISAALAEPAS